MRIYLCNSYSKFLGVEVLCCICIDLDVDITFNDVNFSGLRFSVGEMRAGFLLSILPLFVGVVSSSRLVPGIGCVI